MTATVFFGCTFIAFGPAFALFVFTIARDPLRVIVLIAGAFFWLVSLLMSSLLWFIAYQLSDKTNEGLQRGLLIMGVLFSIAMQETFRYGYFRLLKKANEGLASLGEESMAPISIRQMAYVSGLGFGMMSGAFSGVNILAESLGPGTVGIHGDSAHYFLSSAFMTMAMVLLHTAWGVVFFQSCDRKHWWGVAAVVLSHVFVSSLTFANPNYEASLIPAYLMMVAFGTWAYFTSGGSLRNIKSFVTCKSSEYLLASHRQR